VSGSHAVSVYGSSDNDKRDPILLPLERLIRIGVAQTAQGSSVRSTCRRHRQTAQLPGSQGRSHAFGWPSSAKKHSTFI